MKPSSVGSGSQAHGHGKQNNTQGQGNQQDETTVHGKPKKIHLKDIASSQGFANVGEMIQSMKQQTQGKDLGQAIQALVQGNNLTTEGTSLNIQT